MAKRKQQETQDLAQRFSLLDVRVTEGLLKHRKVGSHP